MMEKYSREWKMKHGKWIQRHGDVWKIHYIENETEYSTGEYLTAAAATADLKNY